MKHPDKAFAIGEEVLAPHAQTILRYVEDSDDAVVTAAYEALAAADPTGALTAGQTSNSSSSSSSSEMSSSGSTLANGDAASSLTGPAQPPPAAVHRRSAARLLSGLSARSYGASWHARSSAADG